MNIPILNYVDADAKKWIEDVIKTLEDNHKFQASDIMPLSLLAQNLAVYLQASKELSQSTLTLSTESTGTVKANPLITIMNNSQAQALKIMSEFGLTRKSRKKLDEDKEITQSPLLDFLEDKNE